MQIQDVSTRYAEDVAELRAFLAQAGVSCGTAEALRGLTTRLQEDRAFRRDLTSHAWVILNANPQVRHADLLAMLAIAAAGPRFAADAADSEAHDLLRYVMQVWRSFHGSPESSSLAGPRSGIAPTVVSSTVQRAQASAAVPDTEQPISFAKSVPRREAMFSFSEPEDADGQRRVLWMGTAAGALVVALLGGFFLFHHAAVPAVAGPPAVTSGVPEIAPAVSATRDQGVVGRGAAAMGVRGEGRDRSSLQPYSQLPEGTVDVGMSTSRSASQPRAAAQRYAKPAPSTPMPTGRAAMTTAARPATRTYSHPTTKARPSEAAAGGLDYVPKVVAVDNLRTRGVPVSAGMLRQAVVRPTSLGIMAGNVTYSPVPVYPAAATAARVQGEVKLEAEVGRDGTVESTRIISGPPLLADAAADAVQRWRYRPYLYEGRPIAMNAQIVMDFQLP